jgi:para-nitrobenzyl esterase
VKPVTRLWLPLFVFCSVTLAPAQSRTDSSLLVAIDSGVLEGAHLGSATDEVMFLGIPYAAPPVGERRWKPPQPVEKWRGHANGDA